MCMSRWFVVLLVTVFAAAARAELKLPAIFSDHMVLQRDAAVPVWGWATPGAAVSVRIAGQSHEARADEAGRWRVALDPLAVGEPIELTCTSEGRTITRTDVLVGEVWLCSGQSNMVWALRRAIDGEREVAAANDERLRLFRVKRSVTDAPLDDLAGGESWTRCTPADAAEFSAVAYYFGAMLRRELGVPVGLIQSAYGGTSAEVWTSEPTLRADPAFDAVVRRYRKSLDDHAAGRGGAPSPNARPAGFYNGMIHPLVPFAIRGVAWYQGEANSARARAYRALLPMLINDWRRAWGGVDGELPFGVVQLPSYSNPPRVPPGGANWPQLREAQLMTAQQLPGVGLIVTFDTGGGVNLHPPDKKPVGERLARWALGAVYGRDVVWSGPVLREMKVEDGKVVLTFDHAGSGLATLDGKPVRGFAIAGADGKFRWAVTEMTDDGRIILSDYLVREPVAVRYGWNDDPHWANLTNREGLPASPFRTDDWVDGTQPPATSGE